MRDEKNDYIGDQVERLVSHRNREGISYELSLSRLMSVHVDTSSNN